MDELHGEPARFYGLPRLAGDELHLVGKAVLIQLELDEAGGHPCGIDGGVDIPHEVGDGTDVVLVAMGDKNGPDAVPVLDEVGEVGDDHVYAVHVVVREAHAHVHHNDVVSVLVDGEVLADLVEAAKRDNFQFFCHNNSFSVKNNEQIKSAARGAESRKRGFDSSLREEPWQIVYHTSGEKYSLFCRNVGRRWKVI